jgi:hydrogenase maturation protein HypF
MEPAGKTSGQQVWRRVRVSGIVQGVGFRPTVYRLARKHNLVGQVCNTARGVELRLGGDESTIGAFLEELPRTLSLPGRIEQMAVEPTDPIAGCDSFTIAPSIGAETIEVVIPPDQATCPECLRELCDPANRRFGYPLITCTICGPRYSIIESLPYDRERTTMRHFPFCPECRAEYESPDDRRFHAETVACTHCGPNLELLSPDGPVVCADPILATVDLLKAGRIVAIKGIGGFHLACDAANEAAVAELRRRKRRIHKPFAILVRDLEVARCFCLVSDIEAVVMRTAEAPIVLLKRRGTAILPVLNHGQDAHATILPQVLAPDNNRLGVMLPYAPIQYLLARHFDALVMTSGNITDEPIRHTEKGMRDLLGPVADFALTHLREIINPSDDSVVLVQRGEPVLIRRARGHVPTPLLSDVKMPPILAVGPDLKNACAFGLGQRVYFSPHIGDLEYPAAFRRHVEEIERFGKWFGEKPRAVACDLHPGYLSTQNAHRLAASWRAQVIEVQHHHAHIAACLAEHGLSGEIIGVAMDGTGFGSDGAIWGGEFMVASRAGFQRFGHLAYQSVPGGDRSIREPWRMLAAYLIEIFGVEWAERIIKRHVAASVDIQQVARVLSGPIRAPQTSSVGRLFDAVGVLLGFPTEITYEAQNAVAVESLCGGEQPPPYELQLSKAANVGPDDDPDVFEISLRGVFEGIVDDLETGVARETIAGRFHAAIIEMIVQGCRRIRERTGLAHVALSGGCFVNTILVEGACARLEAEGFEVLRRRVVPPNDGGIALGQIAVAATQMAAQ